MKRYWRILKKAGAEWSSQNALEWGAALAYYTAFSIAPLLIIALTIVGVVYKGNSLGYIHDQIGNLVGNNAATALTSAIVSVRRSEHGVLANVVSIIVLLVGATSVFGQLQIALNRVWGVQPKPGHFWRDLFKQRMISFAMILGISFLMLVSLLVSAVLAAITGYFEYLLPGANIIWHLIDATVSFAIVVLLFAAIFKIIPDVHIDWKDVWTGAIFTSALFVGGKAAIGFYLGRSGVGSAYGAAGSVLIILAWVYYSSQILFLGAEFTKLYAEERRIRIVPIKGAEFRKAS
ncbi:MAG TPA: YihY/virulence factor BrkB family protein [Terriglobia bacterium]|nr:YihY/virulence factor BrkB family protein [Terriglobia bacterium]